MSLAPISLEDFACDPALGNFSEASPGQRAVLRALDGIAPADAEQERVFAIIAGRAWAADLRSPRRTVAYVAGADSGKSIAGAELLLHRALFGDVSALRRGQRGVALLVAPDTKTAGVTLGYVKGIIGGSPFIQAEVEAETAESVRFHRGTEIAVLPATYGARAVRGRRFIAAVLEECSFFRDQDFVVNDLELVRAIRPRLLPGAQLIGISTPWRKSGWLWNLHSEDFGRCTRSLVLQAPTSVMRPDRDAADLAEIRAEDPISAAAELDAQFLSNVSGLFEPADLQECIESGVHRREAEGNYRFIAAMDPSGLRNDPWALTIVGTRQESVVQFSARAWKPGTSAEQVVEEIAAELKDFGLASVLSDQFGSEITRALFASSGVRVVERPFTTGPASPKTLGFKGLKDLVRGRRIRLLDEPAQTRELTMLEVTRLSGGQERIAAPGRLHDDRACALALACSELQMTAGTTTIGQLTWEDLDDARADPESAISIIERSF